MSKDAEPARRVEIFTGAGRRRDWSDEDRASIVAESPKPIRVPGRKPDTKVGVHRDHDKAFNVAVTSSAEAPVLMRTRAPEASLTAMTAEDAGS